MNRVECAQGHQYDADIHPACPYCDGFQMINFRDVPVGQAGVTMPGAGTQIGQAGATMPGAGNPIGQAGAARARGEIPVGQAGVTMPGRGYGDYPYPGGGRPMGIEDEIRTQPPRGYERRVDEENKTRGKIQKKNGIEPVVGWLVCIEGSEKGKDYRLYGRINTVGRDGRMDVCIRGDQGITREIHVRIGYDPKKNNFHIIPANGSNNTYVNDDPVYIPTKLEAYDVIELGETKLLFLPLCGRRFSWDGGLSLGGRDFPWNGEIPYGSQNYPWNGGFSSDNQKFPQDSELDWGDWGDADDGFV